MGEKNSFCPQDFIHQVQVDNERKIIERLLNSKKSLKSQRGNDPIFTKVYVGWEDQMSKKRKRRNNTEISLSIKPHFLKLNNVNELLSVESSNRVLHSQSVQLPKLSKSFSKNGNQELKSRGRVSDFAKYQHTIEENTTASQTRVHQNKTNLMKQKLMKVVQKVYEEKRAKKSQSKDIERAKISQKSAIFKKIKLQHLKKQEGNLQKIKKIWRKIDIFKLETCFVKLLKNKKEFDDQQLKVSQIKDFKSFQKINVPKRQKVPQFIKEYKPINPNLVVDQIIKSKDFQIVIDDGNSLYFGSIQNDKKSKLGVYISKNYKFQGFWKKDQKYQGYQVTPQGYYIGKFKEGVRHGQGEFIWFNGQNYEGQWKKGLKHGSGIWKSGKGDSYLGQWQNGKVQGYGVHITASGQKYQGQFKDFLKSGKGKQTFPNGDVYDGQYLLGKPNGIGKYIWKNRIYYEGEFAEGFRHGKGTLIADNYIKFVGSFIGQKPNGKGEIEYENGDIFKGQFLQGQKHGKGILKLKNQHKIISGKWNHNQLEDQVQKNNNKQ